MLEYLIYLNVDRELSNSMKLGKVKDFIQGKPINIEERMDVLEKDVHRKLDHFEETLAIYRDVIIKLHEEKNKLSKENEELKKSLGIFSGVKETLINPLLKEGHDFAELVLNDDKITDRRSNFDKSNEKTPQDDKESQRKRTIIWMREKFGLSSKQQKKKRNENK